MATQKLIGKKEKTMRLSVRVTKEEHDYMAKISAKTGVPISTMVRLWIKTHQSSTVKR